MCSHILFPLRKPHRHYDYVETEYEYTVDLITLEVICNCLTSDDYTVTGNEGIEPGSYQIIVEGRGNYEGVVKFDWCIIKHDSDTDTSDSNTDTPDTPDEPDNILYGNINGDGKVKARDFLVVQRYAIKLAALNDLVIYIYNFFETKLFLFCFQFLEYAAQ